MLEEQCNSHDSTDYVDIVLFENDSEEGEDELKVDLSKFNQAVIWGTDWTTETIASQLKKGNIDLNPTFQRRDAWSDAEKGRLIESLMLGIPVPPIILAENKVKKNSYIVIDGKQRLLSIRRFYSDVTEKEFREKHMNEKDEFLQLKLRGLEILKDFDGLTYNEISEKDGSFITNLDNQSIRTIVIKNWPDESFLYTVFLRLNTGSKKLSPQELRQALKPGQFLSFLDDATANSSAFQQMLNNKSADPRMKDIELALRFFGFKFYPEQYVGNLKEFLDYTCEELNKAWDKKKEAIQSTFEQLEEAILFSRKIFSPKSAFSRYNNGKCNDRFNRSIYEILTYYFSNKIFREAIDKCENRFKEEFIKLNDNSEFIRAVSDTTKDINRVITRFEKFANLLVELLSDTLQGVQIEKFELSNDRIVVKNVTI